MLLNKQFLDITFIENEGKGGITGIEQANGNGSNILHLPLLRRYSIYGAG